MKKIFALYFLCCFFYEATFSQIEINLDADVTKGCSSITKGDVFIKSIAYEIGQLMSPGGHSTVRYYGSYFIYGTQKGKQFRVDAYDLNKDFSLESKSQTLQDYWSVKNIQSLYILSHISDLQSLRQKLEDDSKSFLKELEKYNLIVNDPYLETYIYSLLSQIIPQKRVDGFPYNIKVVIVNDNNLNAGIYPDGTLLINTGLLARLHTEDELVAVLAHEIGHFISNHALKNVFQMETNKARADAIALFATMAAAIVEAAAAYNGYYVDGSLTTATAILSSVVAEEVRKNLGLEFQKEQEEEADEIAYKVLELTGRDPNALSTLLKRIETVYSLDGNWLECYESVSHPSIHDRIQRYGIPYTTTDNKFEKKVSFSVTNTAIALFQIGRFSQALELVKQNINNNVATADDYIIMSQCLLNLYDKTETNEKAYQMAKKAKEINADNFNVYKTEIIATLRMQKNEEAKQLLSTYKGILEQDMNSLDKETSLFHFYSQEYNWTSDMLTKVKGL